MFTRDLCTHADGLDLSHSSILQRSSRAIPFPYRSVPPDMKEHWRLLEEARSVPFNKWTEAVLVAWLEAELGECALLTLICRLYSRGQGIFQATGCIPGGRVYSREQGVFQGTGCIPGGRVYSRGQGVFQGTGCIPGDSVYSRGQGVFPGGGEAVFQEASGFKTHLFMYSSGGCHARSLVPLSCRCVRFGAGAALALVTSVITGAPGSKQIH